MLEVSNSIRKTLSFCLITVDCFRGTVYTGPVRIYVDGHLASYIKKASGIYAFINQPDANLTIDAYGFEKYKMHVSAKELTPHNPIVTAKLRPGKEYSYPSTAGGAKLRFIDKRGRPVSDVPVGFYVDYMSGFKAVLTSDAAQGDENIRVLDIYGDLSEHSSYRIISAECDERNEYISVKNMYDGSLMSLEHKLKHCHMADEKLTCAHMTRTDADGFVLVVFNKLHKSEVGVVAEIIREKSVKEVRLKLIEGLIADLGNIEV